MRSRETRRFRPSLPIARPFFVASTVTVACTTSPRCSIRTPFTSKFRNTFADEPIRLIRVLDDVDVPVHEPLQLRDVLALLPDRLADVPFLDDEDQLVAGVHAIDDGRPGQVLEKRDVLDRLLVKDNLGHGLRR